LFCIEYILPGNTPTTLLIRSYFDESDATTFKTSQAFYDKSGTGTQSAIYQNVAAQLQSDAQRF
jgi:hypothetical protein